MAPDAKENRPGSSLPMTLPRPPAARIHPGIYVVIAILGLFYVVGMWSGFLGGGADGGEVGYLLAIVTGFIVAMVAFPLQLWRVRLHGGDRRGAFSPRALRDWLAGDFDTWQERLKGKDAAIQILLPIAAVSILMVIMAFIVTFDVG